MAVTPRGTIVVGYCRGLKHQHHSFLRLPAIMDQNLRLERRGDVFILTLQKPPENRLTSQFCQEIIQTLNNVRKEIGPEAPGAVIIRGNDTKFFCTVRSSALFLKEVIHGVLNSC
jgi:hypothetical protein